MPGILTPFRGQLESLIARIDKELTNIEIELGRIDESVDRDVARLIQEHRQGVQDTELTDYEIGSLYRETLAQKRFACLERAKSELVKMRARISALMYKDGLAIPEIHDPKPHPSVSAPAT
ncbi:MAG: hypothetical protein AB1646_14095 [Thermodesulfobacteriota bacterium]